MNISQVQANRGFGQFISNIVHNKTLVKVAKVAAGVALVALGAVPATAGGAALTMLAYSNPAYVSFATSAILLDIAVVAGFAAFSLARFGFMAVLVPGNVMVATLAPLYLPTTVGVAPGAAVFAAGVLLLK